MITAIAVKVDRTNYCAYEAGRDTVAVTVTATGSVDGDIVNVALRRRTTFDNVRDLTTTPVTITGGIGRASFVLRTLLDADGFRSARCSRQPNDYYAEATAAIGVATGLAVFSVVPVSVERMRAQYMLGLPLFTIERYAPRTQPKVVLGVTVLDVSRDGRLGTFPLALTVVSGTKSLSWNSGGSVTLDLTAPNQYVLNDTTGAYIVVQVDPALLPAVNKSESLTIDLGIMSDDVITDEIVRTLVELERRTGIRFEPTRVASRNLVLYANTKPLITQYDEIAEGLTYYRPSDLMKWLEFKIPYSPLLKVCQLSGWFNKTKTVDIEDTWFASSISERSGVVELVPSATAMISWTFYGPGFYTIFQSNQTVPNFWHFECVSGLRTMPADIITWVAKRAAMTLLAQAGQAKFAGMTSQSVSRDGVSESRSTVPGVYGATIDRYAQDTGRGPDGSERGIPRIIRNYVGPRFITLGP